MQQPPPPSWDQERLLRFKTLVYWFITWVLAGWLVNRHRDSPWIWLALIPVVMTVRAAWIYVRVLRHAPIPSAKTQPPRSAEMTRKEAEQIIHDYAGVLSAKRDMVVDASKLPHSKERIKQALIFALRRTGDPTMRSHLKSSYLSLADWQHGIEDAFAALTPTDPETMNDVDLLNAATRISETSPAREKGLALIKAETAQLQRELEQAGFGLSGAKG